MCLLEKYHQIRHTVLGPYDGHEWVKSNAKYLLL